MPAVKQEGDGQGWKYESVKEDRRKDVERERERELREGERERKMLFRSVRKRQRVGERNAPFFQPRLRHISSFHLGFDVQMRGFLTPVHQRMNQKAFISFVYLGPA